MADAAVRVDIVVGQNTVVPAAQATRTALGGLTGAAGATNFAFEDLNKKGLTKLSSGFKSLAFHAAGVPGPMGKIAEGALLLGGGSGVLLGVAVAAGALAVAWKKLVSPSDEAKAAMQSLRAEMDKMDKSIRNLMALDAEWQSKRGRWGFMEGFLGSPGLIGDLARALLNTANAMKQFADQAARFQGHGATDDFLTGLWKGFDQRDKADDRRAAEAERIRQREAEIAAARASSLPAQWERNADFTNASVWRDLTAQATAFQQSLVSMPAIMDQVDVAVDRLAEGFTDLQKQWLATLELSQEFTDALNDALLGGIMDLGIALAEALGTGGNFGDVIVGAFGKMMEQIGHLLIVFGIQMELLKPLLSNPFTSGAAMIAAGVVLTAAGAAISKQMQSSQVSSRASTGGVSGRQYERDQQALGAPGTITVKMQDGFIRPSDPAFQEWLAEVIRQAKGRNVVFA